MVVRLASGAGDEVKTVTQMRLVVLLVAGVLASCASNPVTIPNESVLTEIPPAGGQATPYSNPTQSRPGLAGTANADTRVRGQMRGPDLPPLTGTPLDDDILNLTLYTIEQQKIDARLAEQQLADARRQLVIVQPQSVPPERFSEVNLTRFAQSTDNGVGDRRYDRPLIADRWQTRSTCARFGSADDAQRAFLANGGPAEDRYNLDPDGDGFACGWDPAPYRQLRL